MASRAKRRPSHLVKAAKIADEIEKAVSRIAARHGLDVNPSRARYTHEGRDLTAFRVRVTLAAP